MHTGHVPLVVEALDAEPPVGGEWEDVVEVSFTADRSDLFLSLFQDVYPVELPAPGTYRVRCSATGMEEARQSDVRDEFGPVVDRYLMQLWPAPPAPEVMVRQAGTASASWHDFTTQARAHTTPAFVVMQDTELGDLPDYAMTTIAFVTGQADDTSDERTCTF